MQGPDRKTPIDAVPAAPDLSTDPLDSREEGSDAPSHGAPGAGESGKPPSALPDTPASLDALESPAAGRAEAETPQAASISASMPEEGWGQRGGTVWTRASSYVDRLGNRMRNASGARKAIAAFGGIAAILGAIFLPRLAPPSDRSEVSNLRAATLAGAVSGLGAVGDGGAAFFADRSSAVPLGDAAIDSEAALAQDGAARATVWRIAQLSDDPAIAIVDVPLAHRPLASALAGARISRAEGARLVASLEDVHGVDGLGPKDSLTVALDKATGHVIAYELAESPADVWQGRDKTDSDGGGAPTLAAQKLKLDVARVRIHSAVLVGADLHASFAEAGLAPVDEMLAMVDDALDGHAELSDVRPGARLRIVATQDQVGGAFVRWVSLEAVEYLPATPGASSVRVYRFDDDDSDRSGSRHTQDGLGNARRRHGWYDAKARQPLHGGWRMPVPLARITSRFNPHRMHPVLHVVMPHTGVDFAAPVGTPVYSTAAGVVTSVGPEGPCGNKVEIAHPGNITSVYCHLARFAPGLHVGLHVEQRQLIAYVGQTGRVTGPHLHFGIRKGGVVIDPMTLRLDGVRVVPRGQRDEFDRHRADLDAELDRIALPPSIGIAVDAPEQGDSFYDEP